MPVRNACVARGTLTNGVSTTIYTVPASSVLLLKGVQLWASTSSATDVFLYLADSQLVTAVNLANVSMAQQAPGEWVGWVALNETDLLRAISVGGDATYWVSGAVLPYNTALD